MSIFTDFSKKENVIILTLCSVYFFITSFHLSILPIFTDESIHIYWAKMIAVSNRHWFISLIDGEPPLDIWIIAVFLKTFPSGAYLIAGRLVSVIAGLIGLLGTYALTRLLVSSRIAATISAILFILCPFLLFFHRIASYDGLLSACGVWTIYFALKSSESRSFYGAFLWGVLLGCALLSKASGIIFLPLSIISFFIVQKPQFSNTYMTKTLLLIMTALLGAEGLQGMLFFSKGYHVYQATGIAKYTVSSATLLKHPFIVFQRNISAVTSWLFYYYPWFLLIFGIGGFFWLFLRIQRVGTLLLFLWGVPIILVCFIGNGIYPRYIFFTTPYFIIAVSYLFTQLFQKKKMLAAGVFAGILGCMIYLDIPLLYNPASAVLPPIDYEQYISGYASGYGLDSVFRFLHSQSHTQPIRVITLGTVSSYPYAFMLEFWNNPRITVAAIWPVEKNTRRQIALSQKQLQTFVILKTNTDGAHKNFLTELHLHEVFRANKPQEGKPIIVALPY